MDSSGGRLQRDCNGLAQRPDYFRFENVELACDHSSRASLAGRGLQRSESNRSAEERDEIVVVVRQIVVSYINRISFYLKEARKLFGFGLQNDSSTGERLLAGDVNRPRPGYEKNRLVFRGMALEATLPPHNDGVHARRSSRPRQFDLAFEPVNQRSVR